MLACSSTLLQVNDALTKTVCACITQWYGRLHAFIYELAANPSSQNALFNSALRQSTSIRKDLDQFADSAAPSPQLQAQLNASLATFTRTIDDYGKLAKQEPVQTKQEKAFERLKNFRSELEEYRQSFKRIKSANEDIVRRDCIRNKSVECSIANNSFSERQKHVQNYLVDAHITPLPPRTPTRNPTSTQTQTHTRPSHLHSHTTRMLHTGRTHTRLVRHRAVTTIVKATCCARKRSSTRLRTSSTNFWIEEEPFWAIWDSKEKC